MKKVFDKLKYWYKYDAPASAWDWIEDMYLYHPWFGPLVSVISSVVGVGIGFWLFSLILSILQR